MLWTLKCQERELSAEIFCLNWLNEKDSVVDSIAMEVELESLQKQVAKMDSTSAVQELQALKEALKKLIQDD